MPATNSAPVRDQGPHRRATATHNVGINERRRARFLKKNDESVQLTVIGGADVGKVADILGPYGHHRFAHTESSVLVVRH